MSVKPKRSTRVADQLKREIAGLLLRKIKDPRVQSVTITGVKLTNDLKKASIYFVLRGDDQKKEEALRGMRSAKGFIRYELGNTLNLKYVPEIEFYYDGSFDYAERIETLIDKIKEEHHSS